MSGYGNVLKKQTREFVIAAGIVGVAYVCLNQIGTKPKPTAPVKATDPQKIHKKNSENIMQLQDIPTGESLLNRTMSFPLSNGEYVLCRVEQTEEGMRFFVDNRQYRNSGTLLGLDACDLVGVITFDPEEQHFCLHLKHGGYITTPFADVQTVMAALKDAEDGEGTKVNAKVKADVVAPKGSALANATYLFQSGHSFFSRAQPEYSVEFTRVAPVRQYAQVDEGETEIH